VPKWLIDKVNILNDKDVEKFGIEFASNIILSIIDKGLANGFHIMAISKVEEVKNLLNYIKIKTI
jgi:methylenetetrahydrofolate reductase (NADPH)